MFAIVLESPLVMAGTESLAGLDVPQRILLSYACSDSRTCLPPGLLNHLNDAAVRIEQVLRTTPRRQARGRILKPSLPPTRPVLPMMPDWRR